MTNVMQPSTPLIQSPPPGMLRAVEHPELSPILTHFCSRCRPLGREVPEDIRRMSAPDRLESILWDRGLRTFVTYSGGDPAVCFTEARQAGLEFLIQKRGYEPWGLLFDRQSVYDAGGGPVWYARPEQQQMLKQLDPRLLSWAVRLDPGSDWLHEREWRIARPAMISPAVGLNELRLAALLVGDPSWNGVRYAYCVAAATGQPRWDYFLPPLPPGLPRAWWNPTTAQIQWLPPLF